MNKEDRKLKFLKLREEWKKSKELAKDNKEIEAIIRENGLNISATNFYFIQQQMKANKMEGLPYLDAKTFNKWKESGFKVKKGEKSKLEGITWIGVAESKEDRDSGDYDYMYPKVYKLFHKSQVEEIK